MQMVVADKTGRYSLTGEATRFNFVHSYIKEMETISL
jgi:hypothetical protein